MQHARGRRERARSVSVGKPEGKNHLEDLNVDGEITSKYIFKNYNRWWEAWTGLIWLRTGTHVGLL
jgi:hypothetical protein